MSRHRASCGLLLLGLLYSAHAAGAEPTAYAVIRLDANIRTAPPAVEPTGKRVPYGTVVVVVDEKGAGGQEYVKVRLRDDPKTEFGWIVKSALGSTKEFDPAMMPEDRVDDQKLTGTKALMAAIYNTRGKYLKEQADALGVSPAALAAVLKVESGGRAFGTDGRTIIRFENHVFGNSWGAANKEKFDAHFKFDAKERWKGHQWRKAPGDPWGACHTSQTSEWEVIEFAKTLDEAAALTSASHGIGQIMGFNHKAVGYASAREMAKKFDEGIKPQLDAMIAFIKGKEKCLRGLRARDYNLFAECYNGTGKANEYGARIKEAADAYAEVTAGKKYADNDLPAEKVTAAFPGLEKYVDELRTKSGVPGLAIAVVHADKVVYLKGFGVRELGKPDPIDADTVFQLASVSKPLTATIIAGAVGDGIVKWDSKTSDLDPAFRLAGDFVTSEVTLRDLLCHRTGLPAHAGDLLEDLGYSRAEVLHRLRFQKLTGLFRSSYAYTNFGFTEAGVATAKAAGKTWEEFAVERLFKPLGMNQTSYRHADSATSANRAKLHARRDGKWVAKYDRQPDAQAPAGGASSTLRDLTKWVRLLLADGTFDGKRVIAADALGETHKPQVISRAAQKPTDPTGFYGLGWNVGHDPAGRLALNHSGGFDLGAATVVVLVPAEKLGIVVLTNGAPIGAPEAVAYHFLDLVRAGKPERDWFAFLAPIFEEQSRPNYGTRVDYTKEPAGKLPPLPAASYAGTYHNDFVGTAIVAEENGKLVLKLGPKLRAFPLTHFDRDTFTYQPEGEMAAGPSGVTFRIGPDRVADAVTLEILNVHGSGTLTRVPKGK